MRPSALTLTLIGMWRHYINLLADRYHAAQQTQDAGRCFNVGSPLNLTLKTMSYLRLSCANKRLVYIIILAIIGLVYYSHMHMRANCVVF